MGIPMEIEVMTEVAETFEAIADSRDVVSTGWLDEGLKRERRQAICPRCAAGCCAAISGTCGQTSVVERVQRNWKMIRALFAFSLISMAACSGPPSLSEERGVLEQVHVDGYKTTWDVLYEPAATPKCNRIVTEVQKVLATRDTDPVKRGFLNRDVEGVDQPFRAYYIPGLLRGTYDSTFIYCGGREAAFISRECSISGTSRYGCFDAGFYGVETPDAIRELDNKIRSRWPASLK